MASRDSAKRGSFIGRFFRGIWRTLTVTYAVVSIAMLLLVPLVLYMTLFGGPAVTVEQDVALVWAPAGDLVEQRTRNVQEALVEQVTAERRHESVVRDLVDSLDHAAGDDRIAFAFLKLDELGGASTGQLQDLAAAIRRFKESGKEVVAWAPAYNQGAYYLAAQADTVYLDPLGQVFLQGFGLYRQYFKDALDKLGVEINVFRVGEYKSFVEPFTRNDMSPEARAANRAWLESLWQTYREGVTAGRELEAGAVTRYVEGYGDTLTRLAGDAARAALNAGLVDKLATVEEMRADMREKVGRDPKHGSFRQIFHGDYLRVARSEQPAPRTDSRIGLIVVEGPIVEGRAVSGAASGENIARLVSKVRRDDHMAALVLRVNSPGGSVYASERIRREIAMLRESGKPVIVSMAGVAASGGYWISMNADQIWAQPATITGSIGVFGLVPTFARPLEKIGVHTDGLGTTPLSGAFQATKPLDDTARRILQSGVEHTYNRFIREVAEARGMGVEAVDRIAQGRVWSGADAARIGLVDKLGGLERAMGAAAEAAGLQPGDYRLEVVRQADDWRSALLELLSLEVGSLSWLPDWIARLPLDSTVRWLGHGLSDPRDLYAHCFCEIGAVPGDR
ncbi:signal peptide peptidase SppA, 67K type [Salinisphaera sp. PC39]|uniref:signal peptide peptidase SppA n=1 Tax=Salinisphaera sp. PC39 TaxID=1304156 RepID=UPI00334029C0